MAQLDIPDASLAILSSVASVISILTFLVSLFIAANARLDSWQAIEREFQDFACQYRKRGTEFDLLYQFRHQLCPGRSLEAFKEGVEGDRDPVTLLTLQFHISESELIANESEIRLLLDSIAPPGSGNDGMSGDCMGGEGWYRWWEGGILSVERWRAWRRSYELAKKWPKIKRRAWEIRNDRDVFWGQVQMMQLLRIGRRVDEMVERR